MAKKLGGVLALLGTCALSSFLLSCGSSSSRPSGVLYALTQGSNGYGNNVSSFAMDLNSGVLSLVNSNANTCPTAASASDPEPCGLPLDILLDPTGANAFVLNQGTPCIQQGNVCIAGTATILPTIYPFTVNSDGSLSQPGTALYWTCLVQPAAPCTATNSNPDTALAMVRDAAGQFLFVIDQGVYPQPLTCPAIGTAVNSAADATNFLGCPSISVFTMAAGSLTPVSQSSIYQSPFFLSKTPSALSPITFTASGTSQELLFATNNYDLCTIDCLQPGATNPAPGTPNNDTVSVYALSSSGVLTEQPNSPYPVSAQNPISLLAVNTNIAGQATGGVFVYVGQGAGAGAVYPFYVCTAQNSNTNCSPSQTAGNFMFPLTTCPLLSCQVPPSAVGAQPVQMVVDPTNTFLYGISNGANQVWGFKIATTAGSLAPQVPPNLPAGTAPVSIAIHPTVDNTGQYLYVSANASDNIIGFTISTTTGTMSALPPSTAPSAPSGIAVH
jgi:hypothetical protein